MLEGTDGRESVGWIGVVHGPSTRDLARTEPPHFFAGRHRSVAVTPVQ